MLKPIRGVCRHCVGRDKSATSRMWVRRRALIGAKRLRSKYGLTQNLLVPWYALSKPKHFARKYWARLLVKLERHELVVWNALLNEVESVLR